MLKVVIFDFDGVIGDTKQLGFAICKEADSSLTMKKFEEAHNGNTLIHPTITIPLDFAKKQRRRFTRDNLFSIISLFPKLAKAYTLCIVSSSDEDNIRHYLSLGNADQYFDLILGSNFASSKVEKFKAILDNYNVKTNECIFITDTVGDLKEAAKVNLPTIAVSWGYHSVDVLQKYTPYAIIHNPEELFKEIQTIK